jgi:hypothetical protein
MLSWAFLNKIQLFFFAHVFSSNHCFFCSTSSLGKTFRTTASSPDCKARPGQQPSAAAENAGVCGAVHILFIFIVRTSLLEISHNYIQVKCFSLFFLGLAFFDNNCSYPDCKLQVTLGPGLLQAFT